jgi:DEAD/DEAH box helicase domain-containing protein
VNKAFYEFLTDEEQGIFKGPYISLKLPFVKSSNDTEIPLEIQPPFPPYDHQLKSFKRFHSAGGQDPKSTLITTGTECFLYPILDYCYKQQHRQGIKVIIF